MKFKCLIFGLFWTFLFSFSAHAETQKIHYFPVGKLTLCKGCGHSHSDTWRGKFRIENVSDEDLILYGHFYDGEFSPGGLIQRRSPDVCEWQYGNGKIEYLEWSKQSSLNKEEFILKSKQSIQFESHFGEFDLRQITRFTTCVKEKSAAEPHEIFSDAFTLRANEVKDENGNLLRYENFVFVDVDENCNPNCKLSIEQSPSVKGIKLEMTLDDFKVKFPKAKISKSKEKKYNIKWAWLWDWNADASDISVTFLDDRIVRIETKFKSLENARDKGNLYLIVAEKLGLENFWTSFSNTFECKDFLIDVLPNQNPTITIWIKSFIEVRDKMNEEAIRKK